MSQASGVSEGISTVTVVPGSGGGRRSSAGMFERSSEGLVVGKAGGDTISDFTVTGSGSKTMEEPSSGSWVLDCRHSTFAMFTVHFFRWRAMRMWHGPRKIFQEN